MQDASTLLANSSIRTAERYYASWDRSRRGRLAAIVRDANEGNQRLSELAGRSPKTSAGAVPSSPANGPANQFEVRRLPSAHGRHSTSCSDYNANTAPHTLGGIRIDWALSARNGLATYSQERQGTWGR